MKIYLIIISAALSWIAMMPTAAAIPPPDFIFNVGSQIAQVFSILVLFLSALIATTRQYARVYFDHLKHKKIVWALIAAIVLAVAWGGASYYEGYRQDQALQEWQKTADPLDVVGIKESKSMDNLSISNEELKSQINGGAVFVLDAREDKENEIGNFPGSKHIRYADLVDGRWTELPTDKEVYVLCWSGIRGKEVAEFLRTKGVNARYLLGGADDWVSWGGDWNGEIKFSNVYSEYRYKVILNLAELDEAIADGNSLIDSRKAEKYAEWHIPGSINVPIIYTPSDEIDAPLKKLPLEQPVITICDDWVSCFDAKLVGVRLEELGYVFRGRYNNPLEYKNAR